MAWSIGSNVTAGSVLTASRYNQDVIANLTELAPLFGAWTSYTPVFSQTGKTINSYTNQIGAYVKVGRLVIARVHITLNSVSGTGTGSHTITLPVNSSITSNFTQSTSQRYVIGSGMWLDSGTAAYVAQWALISQGAVTSIVTDSGGTKTDVATNDQFSFTVMYEAAS